MSLYYSTSLTFMHTQSHYPHKNEHLKNIQPECASSWMELTEISQLSLGFSAISTDCMELPAIE